MADGAAPAAALARGEVLKQRKREFRAFIEADLNGAGPYTQKISAMVRRGEQRLIIDLAHLRAWDPNFTRRYSWIFLVAQIHTQLCYSLFRILSIVAIND
jgi:hypothetical protein